MGQASILLYCHRSGEEYTWYANNLPANVNAKDITTAWLFGKRWKIGNDN